MAKGRIGQIDERLERRFGDVMEMMLRQREDTTEPLIGDKRSKAERMMFSRQTLRNAALLGSFHDEMAQRQGLTKERPISKQWWADVVNLQKELDSATAEGKEQANAT